MNIPIQLPFTCALIIFLSVVYMNVVKKNATLIVTYQIQSLAVVALLCFYTYQEKSIESAIVTLCVFVVKALIAPKIFFRTVRQNLPFFSASTYLSVPLTLGGLLLLTLFSQSDIFTPLVSFITPIAQLQMLLIGSLLLSIFLLINQKGILSHIIGILSLENSVFAIGYFLSIRQSAALEIGMLFDVFFWVIVSSIMIRMIATHHGQVDIGQLQELKT